MLEKRLAKMEEILLSPDETSNSTKTLNHHATEEEEEEDDEDYDTSEFTMVAKCKNGSSKRSSEDNHDCTSPTSFSSISSNFPSPSAHLPPSTLKQDEILPPFDVIEHIVDLYFKYFFSALPIFHEETLRSQIKERKCPDFLLLSLLGACAR